MTDRDSVETHLMIIKTWASFALEKDINFFEPAHFRDVVRWVGDAIELLKEQEVKEQLSDAVHETAKQFRQTIVRCKDCKNHGTMDCPMCEEGNCIFHTADNWFCANGERK